MTLSFQRQQEARIEEDGYVCVLVFDMDTIMPNTQHIYMTVYAPNGDKVEQRSACVYGNDRTKNLLRPLAEGRCAGELVNAFLTQLLAQLVETAPAWGASIRKWLPDTYKVLQRTEVTLVP